MTERLTREQAAIIGAATGVLCGPFSDCHELIEKLLKRPVFTHEMASKEVMDEINESARILLIDICAR